MTQVSFKDLLGFTMLNGIPCIDPAQVKFIPGYNVRDAFAPETDADDAQLADNMSVNGFIVDKPITVRIVGNQAYVVAGHRRISAANWLNHRHTVANTPAGKVSAKAAKAIADNRPVRGVTFIPEAVQANGEIRSPVEMSYDLELSNTGKPLSPAERGANILRLRAMGEDDATIAKRLGIGTRWVADLAKLGRSDPRLKALVKAGVIPPTTAILLERAHGAAKGTEIAVAAAGIAKAEGKAKATGRHVGKAEVAAGVKAKVGGKNKKGADTRATSTPVKMTVAPAVSTTSKAGVTVSTLAGPFHLGKDLEERTLYDANGLELCEMADVGMARAMLQLAMLGWNVLKGTSATPAVETTGTARGASMGTGIAKPAAPIVVKPAVAPEPTKAEVKARAALAKAEAEAKAEREAAHQARVAAQVLAEDAKRVAASNANKAAIAAMGAKAKVNASRAKSRATVAEVLAVVAKAKVNGKAKPAARK